MRGWCSTARPLNVHWKWTRHERTQSTLEVFHPQATPESHAAVQGFSVVRRLLGIGHLDSDTMNIPDLSRICQLTIELTKLRQAECKHLSIEDFAPELFGKLLREFAAAGGSPFSTDELWKQANNKPVAYR